MKRSGGKILFLLSFLAAYFAVTAQAQTTYYVSTAGSDGNNGTALATPFKTIGKAAAVMKAGDQCLIRQGIYRETVKPANSGTSGAPLSFEAYNNELVYISGADPVTGWTVHSGSIYKASMTWNLGKYKNQVVVDGKMAWNARTPNVDDAYSPDPYLLWCGGGFGVVDRRRWQQTLAEPVAVSQRVCFGGENFNNSVSDASNSAYRLPKEIFNHPADFFKGGLITLQNFYWQATALITSSQSSANQTTVVSAPTNSRDLGGGGPGWISHVFGLLDAPNEWYRDSATQTLYLWSPDGANPSTHVVEAKRRVLGFDLTGKSYINLRKLRFIATSLTTKDAQHCGIEECQFKYVSHDDAPGRDEIGVAYEINQNVGDGHLGVYLGGSNNVMRKCMVRGSANSGIVIGGKYDTVTNCRVTSCDYSITYHAGVLVISDNGDWSAANMPLGARITRSYFAYNNRANIQVGSHASGAANPSNGIKIQYNEFGTAGYTSETGQVAMQSSEAGDLSYNKFHDAAFVDVGSTCLEEDFGAQNWKVYHNVFYQGDSSVLMAPGGPVVLRCCDFTFSAFGGEQSMCFNNTIVDTSDPVHNDWEFMTTDFKLNGPPWATPIHKNDLYALSDTAPWKFKDPRKRDYSLTALSTKAIDKGVTIPGYVDAYKGAAPDLGAFEYGDTPWVAGPDWAEVAWVYPPPDLSRGRPLEARNSNRIAPLRMSRMGDYVTLNAPEAQDRTVLVFDTRGQVVYRAQWNAKANTHVLDTRGWTNHVYMIRVVSDAGVISGKLCAGR
jgi:hypothetical protein